MTASIADDAITLIEDAGRAGVPLRLVGGLAVSVLCRELPARTRDDQDLDLASTSRHRADVVRFLEARGFEPDRHFNAAHGHKQLYFRDPATRRTLDVLVDRLEMCHRLDFGDRLERLPHTLDAADLLLSKLQIVELNAKDAQDALYLLGTRPIAQGDAPGTIGLDRFTSIVANDWPWWRTTTMNLERLADVHLGPEVVAAMRYDAHEQARELLRLAHEVPKSRRWRLRARIGERVRWYELPEEEQHE